MSALSPRQMFLLDEACHPINEGLGDYGCYHVGTSAQRGEYRDVDVRFIMRDKQHDRLTKAIGEDGLTFLGLAIGEYLAARTGLPIDFQIQRQTEANIIHSGFRNPLGIRDLTNYKGDATKHDSDVKKLHQLGLDDMARQLAAEHPERIPTPCKAPGCMTKVDRAHSLWCDEHRPAAIASLAERLMAEPQGASTALTECTEPHVCPECTAGKHRNCTKEAWCNDRDDLTTCDCASAAEHREATT